MIQVASTTTDQEVLHSETNLAEIDTEISQAKQRKTATWHKEEVYNEVIEEGQKFMMANPQQKSSYVLRATKNNKLDFRTGSPTCSHESLCLAPAIIASLKRNLCSVNIRTDSAMNY